MTLLRLSARRRLAVGASVATLATLTLLPASAGTAAAEGEGSASLQPVANLPFAAAPGSTPNRGTDIEFAELQGKQHALAGTYKNGLQIIDISRPDAPKVVSVYDCGVQQGDVQVFTRKVAGKERTYAGFTMDTGYTATQATACFQEAKALGFKVGTNGFGTFIADITNPKAPRTVSWVGFPKGSHNHTIHPDGGFLYNSNSDLITSLASGGPSIEVYDIRDLSAPKRLPDLALPPVPTSLGAESHDITFSDDGKRAYSAALSQTAIIDTTDPGKPSLVTTIVDPMINVVHQADPVRIEDPVLGERDFLVIEDEFAGASGTGQCPNGGVHVYDVTGPLEQRPVKVGYWNIDDVGATQDRTLGRCTAHVFDLHQEAGIMTIAYYNGGVRVVDLSSLVGAALGTTGVGMKELGWYRFADQDTWAAKTPKIAKDGSFFLYGNDQARGLDVYRFDPAKAGSASAGTWMGATEAALELAKRPKVDLKSYQLWCLSGGTAV